MGQIFETACKANHTHTWWHNMSHLNIPDKGTGVDKNPQTHKYIWPLKQAEVAFGLVRDYIIISTTQCWGHGNYSPSCVFYVYLSSFKDSFTLVPSLRLNAVKALLTALELTPWILTCLKKVPSLCWMETWSSLVKVWLQQFSSEKRFNESSLCSTG